MKKISLLLCLVFCALLVLNVAGCKGGSSSNGDCAKGHLFTNYIYNDDATCLADGTETSSCRRANCNATHTREREGTKLHHKLVIVPYSVNGCNQDGVMAHYRCERCQNLFDQTKGLIEDKTSVIIPAAHVFSETEWYRGSDGHALVCSKCNAKGEVHAHIPEEGVQPTIHNGVNCVECGYEITPPIYHEHNLTFVQETNSSCNEQGVKAHYKCTVCASMFKDAQGVERVFEWDLIKPYAHEWAAEETIVEEALPNRQGAKARYCVHGCGTYTDLRPYLYDDDDWTGNA